MRRALSRLPYGWKPASKAGVDQMYSIWISKQQRQKGIRRFTLLYEGTVIAARDLELEKILEAFESDVSFYVAEHSRDRLFFHSGVVGWEGKAILLPGVSFSGKSTLVAELVKAGATYYSDEYAVVDSRGRIHPFPLPISLRKGEKGELVKHSLNLFNAEIGEKPLPVGLIVVSQYKKGAQWSARSVSAGQGVLDLLSNALAARRSPGEALGVLRRIVDQASVLKGDRGEATEAAPRILRSLEN